MWFQKNHPPWPLNTKLLTCSFQHGLSGCPKDIGDLVNQYLSDNPEKTCYIHVDFATRILPEKFRCAQADFYARAGMSMSIASCLVAKEDGSFETTHFAHVFNGQLVQDSEAVLAIDRHLLSSIKSAEFYPQMEQAIMGSDCANCYLSNRRINGLTEMEKLTGVKVGKNFLPEI